MRILITGISGLLGSSLAAHLRAEGHEVSGARHRLGEPPQAVDAELVIHGAHDFSAGAVRRNREGTLAMFEAASAAGSRQIYISSYSARADSPSPYGATKYAIEQEVLARGGTIVRPGLVAGGGGMFARYSRDVGKRSFVPLVYPDAKAVAMIALPDLLLAFSAILARSDARAWNLFSEPLISSREFVEAVWRARGRRGRVWSVAPWIALAALSVVSPAMRDSLRGQLANQRPVHNSNLKSLVPQPTGPIAAVEQGTRL